MLRYIQKLIAQFNRAGAQNDPDLCYFGGIEEDSEGLNAVPVALYVPGAPGLVYLPYQATNEAVIAQLRDMETGEAFYLREEESVGPLSGDILAIERITPRQVIRIEGRPGNYPDAPLISTLKLP